MNVKTLRSLVFVSIFLVSALAGFYISTQGKWLEPCFRFSLHTVPSHRKTNIFERQSNWLIIRVDQTTEDARLESIWLAVQNKESRKITFVKIFPIAGRPQQNHQLAAAFSLENGEPNKDFWNILNAVQPIRVDRYLLTTRQDISHLIDILGGVTINNQKLNGKQAVSQIPAWQDDPVQASAIEQDLLSGICAQLEDNSKAVENFAIHLLLHARPNKRLPLFLQFATWAEASQSHSGAICKFPMMVTRSR